MLYNCLALNNYNVRGEYVCRTLRRVFVIHENTVVDCTRRYYCSYGFLFVVLLIVPLYNRACTDVVVYVCTCVYCFPVAMKCGSPLTVATCKSIPATDYIMR